MNIKIISLCALILPLYACVSEKTSYAPKGEDVKAMVMGRYDKFADSGGEACSD